MADEFDVLRKKFPRLIEPSFFFECGPGWIGILDRFFGEVDAVLPGDVLWRNAQIKEKLGTLRLYCEPLWPGKKPTVLFGFDFINVGTGRRARGGSDVNEADVRIQKAKMLTEERSAYVCEQCGKPGCMRATPTGYLHTACDEHGMGDPVPYDPVYHVPGGRRYCYDPALNDIVEIKDGMGADDQQS